MSEKLFSVVGVSELNGEYKVRFANDISRMKVLDKNGHTDIRLIMLDEPMTKFEAVTVLATIDEFMDVDAKLAIDEFFNSKVGKATTPKVVEAVTVLETTEEPVEAVVEETPVEATEDFNILEMGTVLQE